MSRKATKAKSNIVLKRKDGLMVFFDGDKDQELDRIRMECPDRRKVILTVALRRFQQIAINYAHKHAPDLEEEIVKIVSSNKLLK